VLSLFRTKVEPFHVEVEPLEMKMKGINMFPMMHFMMTSMSDSRRRNAVTKQNAPVPGKAVPRDRYDLTGKTPYTIEEIKPNKIWQVTYDMENRALSDKALAEEMKAFGMNPTEEKYQEKCLKAAGLFGNGALEVVKKDLETAKFWYGKENITGEEIMEAGPMSIKMFVVKLNSGALLLYAPVRIRQEVAFGDWLDKLGPVEWIVVASSYHTLNIRAVAERYPEAKIVGSPEAEDKLKFVNGLVRNKFDYNLTDRDDLEVANAKLAEEGVQLHYVEGDVACDAVVAIAHNIALECDLVYGHHDGEGLNQLTKEEFRKFKPEDWETRLFKFASISKPNSPHGFLPNYRYQMMDYNSLGGIDYDQPAKDGSTCGIMANSLRRILMLEFESSLGVHCNLQTRDEFRRNINAAWNWLDGNTLI